MISLTLTTAAAVAGDTGNLMEAPASTWKGYATDGLLNESGRG